MKHTLRAFRHRNYRLFFWGQSLSIVLAFDAPIRSSFTPEMVPSRQDLPSAIALNGGMQNGGRMVAPAIGGVLLAATSEALCFLVNGISKLALIASLVLMTIPPQPKIPPTARIWASFKEGAAYAWNLVPVRLLLPIVALVSFMVTPYLTLMPIFAAEVFSGGADTLGFLIGAAGFGGLVGVLHLASRHSVRGLARWTAIAAGLSGAAMIGFSYSRLLPLSLALMAVAGFGVIAAAMSVNMIMQTIVEDEKRGRVISFFTMSFLGMHPLGSLAAGALASWIGAPHTLAVGGLCSVIGACVLWRKLPVVRAHIRPIYARLGISRE